jgi:hypothetical protein
MPGRNPSIPVFKYIKNARTVGNQNARKIAPICNPDINSTSELIIMTANTPRGNAKFITPVRSIKFLIIKCPDSN